MSAYYTDANVNAILDQLKAEVKGFDDKQKQRINIPAGKAVCAMLCKSGKLRALANEMYQFTLPNDLHKKKMATGDPLIFCGISHTFSKGNDERLRFCYRLFMYVFWKATDCFMKKNTGSQFCFNGQVMFQDGRSKSAALFLQVHFSDDIPFHEDYKDTAFVYQVPSDADSIWAKGILKELGPVPLFVASSVVAPSVVASSVVASSSTLSSGSTLSLGYTATSTTTLGRSSVIAYPVLGKRKATTIVPLSVATTLPRDEKALNEEEAASTVVEDEDDDTKYMRFKHVLPIVEKGGVNLRLEERDRNYMWGLMNIGDLPGLPRNRADGDKWDAFCPGYRTLDTNQTYTITGIIGVVYVDNKNHKIAVRINESGYDYEIAQKEIAFYSAVYARDVRPNAFVPYPQCMDFNANPFPDIDSCLSCGDRDNHKGDRLLLCDKKISSFARCNHTMHMMCAGLDEIPKGDWFCCKCAA